MEDDNYRIRWELKAENSQEIGSHSQSTLELHHPCEHAKSGNHVVEIVYISEAKIYNKAGQHATADENMRIKWFTWLMDIKHD